MFSEKNIHWLLRLGVCALLVAGLSACSGGNSESSNTQEVVIDGSDAGDDVPTVDTTDGSAGGDDGLGDGSDDGISGATDDGSTGGSDDGLSDDTDGGSSDGTDDGSSEESDAGVSDDADGGSSDGTDAGTGDGSDNGASDDTDGGMGDSSDAGAGDDTDGGTADGSSDGTGTDGGNDDGGNDDGGSETPTLLDPVVLAPENESALTNETVTLEAQIEQPDAPATELQISWSTLSGPDDALFNPVDAATTSAQFGIAGNYVLEISASNGSSSASDTVTVTITDPQTNMAPSVNAGNDTTIEIDDVLALSGNVADDDLPNGSLLINWRMVSGPGTVTFGETSSESTTATFSAAGNYVIELEASDSELVSTDTLSVEVNFTIDNSGNANANAQWSHVSTNNGSTAQARHEAGGVSYQGKFYLLGGRGTRRVDRYDPATNRWESIGEATVGESHYQPVAYNGKIYVVGALEGSFPVESVVPTIRIFDIASGQWSNGDSIPANRRRGSAGTVVYNNRFYIVGGTTNGHDGGMVNWFDEYNPATGQWTSLPNAPTARDHFSAVVVGNKLIAAGGRQTDHPATFQGLISAVDVYNFDTNTWGNGAAIPTRRAGAMVVKYGNEVIVIAGETDSGSAALGVVEAYNTQSNSWRTLKSLNNGRHGGGAGILGNDLHVVSGNLTTGGGNETQSHEKLKLD